MRHTFRAQTLQQAMQQVAQNLGPEATVIRTAEVRVPHHDQPVGFEVTAEGFFQSEGIHDENEIIESLSDASESQSADATNVSGMEIYPPLELELEECVEEVMVQLLDVVHQMNGIRKVHTHWMETRTLLEEAQREIERITHTWETTAAGFDGVSAFGEPPAAGLPLWNRSERTVAAVIGPCGSGKTTATLRIANRATQNGVEAGIIQWKPGGEFDANVNALTLTEGQVPLRQASSKQEVMRAIFELSSCELVLIDTEAHSPWDPQAVQSLLEALDGPGMEFHLVLPATWDRGEWLDSIGFYEGRISGLIGSHVDRIQGTPLQMNESHGEPLCVDCWMDSESLWSGGFDPSSRQKIQKVGKNCPPLGEPSPETTVNIGI